MKLRQKKNTVAEKNDIRQNVFGRTERQFGRIVHMSIWNEDIKKMRRYLSFIHGKCNGNGKKMQQFSTIQSGVNVFRVFAFFPDLPRTFHAIFEMSNSFDTVECIENVVFSFSETKKKKREKINSVDVIYNLYFLSVTMQRTKQRNSSTMLVSTSSLM